MAEAVTISLKETDEDLGAYKAPAKADRILQELTSYGAGKILDPAGLAVGEGDFLAAGKYTFDPFDPDGWLLTFQRQKGRLNPSKALKQHFERIIEQSKLSNRSILQRKRKFEEIGRSPEELFVRPEWHCLPSYGPATTDRRFKYAGNDSKGLIVMGRAAVRSLTEVTRDLIEGNLRNPATDLAETIKVLVHGAMGLGKSHCCLTTARHLSAEYEDKKVNGQTVRIVYIADCAKLIEDHIATLQEALVPAFPSRISLISCLRTEEDIVSFLKASGDRVIFIQDQYQALSRPEAAQPLQLMKRICRDQKEIRITSGGAEEVITRASKSFHFDALPYAFDGGLQPSEVNTYLQLYGTGCKNMEIAQKARQELGQNPGMLALWFESWCNQHGKHTSSLLSSFREAIAGDQTRCVLGDQVFWKDEGSEDISSEALPAIPESQLTQQVATTVNRANEASSSGQQTTPPSTQADKEAKALDVQAWRGFLQQPQITAIAADIEQSIRAALQAGKSTGDELVSLYIRLSLTSETVALRDNLSGYVNPRYFIIENGSARPAFPLVQTQIIGVLERSGGGHFFYDDSRAREALNSALSLDRVPDSVGRAAERCAIGAIAVGGGHQALLDKDRFQKKFKDTKLNPQLIPTCHEFDKEEIRTLATRLYDEFFNSNDVQRLHVFRPRSPYYPAIDTVVLHFVRERKGAAIHLEVACAQVSLQSFKDHETSTAVAMNPLNIEPWCEKLKKERGRLLLSMNFIVPKVRIKAEEQGAKLVNEQPSRARWNDLEQCEHILRILPFGSIDSSLAVLDDWPSV